MATDEVKPRKLIVCCDGTWNRRDSADAATNVAKMARALRPIDDSGISQLIYYHPGVGTGNRVDQILGGAFGVGLSANVQSAYAFMVDNYQPGDYIFLFGFSRGAYTARSLAGLISLIGLMDKADMELFPKIWEIYHSRPFRDAIAHATIPATADKPMRVRGADETQAALRAIFPGGGAEGVLEAIANSRPAQIFFMGVWDTVGSLGIPYGPLRSWNEKTYEFHDTDLSEVVAHAYHALAIDERRRPFQPTLWTRPKGRGAWKGAKKQVLEQVWFAGCHSNVGGGYKDCGLSDISFLWMAAKAASAADEETDRPLAFDTDYLGRKIDRGWGALINSSTGQWKVLPASVRAVLTPEPEGKETCQRIHQSVVLRFQSKKAGDFEPFPYQPANAQKLLDKPDQNAIAELLPFEKTYRPQDVL